MSSAMMTKTHICPMYETPQGSGQWYSLYAPGCQGPPTPYYAPLGTTFHCDCVTGQGCAPGYCTSLGVLMA